MAGCRRPQTRAIIIDSTSLRAYSGNVSGSSPPKRRAWRKLHIVVIANTSNILASALTNHRARDVAQVPVLVAQADDPSASAMADSGYDTVSIYAAIGKTLTSVAKLVPPGQRSVFQWNS